MVDQDKAKLILLKLIKHQRPDIYKIHIYVKDPLESKYQLLINRTEKLGIKELRNRKSSSNYSQKVDDIYQNLEDYNLKKKSANSS